MQDFEFSREKPLSISDVTALIKNQLETAFSFVKLEGEISNFKVYSSGHAYFTLKDENAQISAVMFKSSFLKINFVPKDGDKVQATGKITVYAQRGNYQIMVLAMEQSGEGKILQMLEERKRFLAAQGLFDSARKKALPHFPKVVGVVTSPSGAAIRDILQVTRRRNKNVSLLVLPSLVQGENAAEEIALQIETANEFNLCDVLIIARGGGSLEDLLPFSEERTVRAVAASKIPTISAIGHEIDWALCDYACDVRAPTPSAAAEIAVPQLSEIILQLDFFENEMKNAILAKTEKLKLLAKAFSIENLETQIRLLEQPLLNRFENAKIALTESIQRRIADSKSKIEQFSELLENLNPKTILKRGFSIVREKQSGKIIKSAKTIKPQTILEISPLEGKIFAKVEITE